MSGNLSIKEGKRLLALCRAGKLYEIEVWVAAGRSIQVQEELRKTPLQIAVDLGFPGGSVNPCRLPRNINRSRRG
jgi:hypothetical protein